MNEEVDRFWYELVRRTGRTPPPPPLDEEEVRAEFEHALAAAPHGEVSGDPSALLSEIYGNLRQRAEQLMRHQRRDHTLQATALANEACLKLMGRTDLGGVSRDDLFGLACRAMRSVLVDHARRRGRRKRAGNGERLPLDDVQLSYQERSIDLVALGVALEELEKVDKDMVKAVDLHFFGGLSLPETARILAMPQRTLERHWALTKAWLRNRIDPESED